MVVTSVGMAQACSCLALMNFRDLDLGPCVNSAPKAPDVMGTDSDAQLVVRAGQKAVRMREERVDGEREPVPLEVSVGGQRLGHRAGQTDLAPVLTAQNRSREMAQPHELIG